MALRFFNSLTRQKEDFVPIRKDTAGLYTCGPTVYDYAHIGNFRAYAFEDLLRRYLKYRGFRVKQVMNITDVDDKIIRSIRGRGITMADYTRTYIDAFFQDLDSLNIERAEEYPRATGYIDDMVKIIKILQAKGIAYKGEDGSIYFSIARFPGYGKLAHINVEELKAGARVKHDEYEKENVSDFALWKAWDPDDGDVFWDTELGRGRPGWHIECSAMSSRNLGKHFDIHTGGIDNLFPHHENEIAQSEGAFGGKFVNYWLHCDHLLVDGTKMAKSKNNFFTLRDITARGYDPIALRYLYVTSDYRKKLDFTFKGLEAAGRTLERLHQFLRRMRQAQGQGEGLAEGLIDSARQTFQDALDDDLNASLAMAGVFTFVSQVNKAADEGRVSGQDGAKVIDFMLDLDRVLGLRLEEALVEKGLAREIESLIEERLKARREKNFQKADDIRDRLRDMGIELMDTPQGTRWKPLASRVEA
jgi:cysteinyl-tRNA synthetase